MNHPNALIAGGTALGPGLLAVWLLGHFGVNIPAEVGVVIAGAATSTALFIGHNGIRGAARRVWRGRQRDSDGNLPL